MSDWSARRRALVEAHEAFVAAARALPPAWRDRPGVCGHWSPRQVAAHLAAWDREADQRLRQIRAGPTPDRTYDLDARNAEAVAAMADLSWHETLAALTAAFAGLRATLAQVTPADRLTDDRFDEWVAGRTGDYREHRAQIAVWLKPRVE